MGADGVKIRMSKKQALVEIKNLTIGFTVEDQSFEAVDSLSFTIPPRESIGLVGESGCGKTVTALSLMRLLPSPPAKITGGEIKFMGKNILAMGPGELQYIRGKEIGIIFQEPLTSLNPVKKIGLQISEALRVHFPGLRKQDIFKKTILIMKKTGLPSPERIYHSYPHMLSGGMLQRAMIAAAMITRPHLLIADEPTTALDVTIQAQIMDVIKSLQAEYDMSVLLITHNLGLVSELCNRIIIMYAGRIVETATRKRIFSSPLHPYTKGLLASVPLVSHSGYMLPSIPGSVPHPKDYLPGCRFLPRCDRKMKICERPEPPPLFYCEGSHFVSCWLYKNSKKDKKE
jgi:peptide/nickel transport system ATP-binding protein